MEDFRIETLDDADLENVSGGAGIGISIGGDGISLTVPNPLAVAGKVVGGTLKVAGGLLEGAGHVLGKIGGHFH